MVALFSELQVYYAMRMHTYAIHLRYAEAETPLGLVSILVVIAGTAHNIRPRYAGSVTLLVGTTAAIGVRPSRH